MTTEEKTQQLKNLKISEDELRKEKNFKALISVYDESMKLHDSIDNCIERIPQKAYCFARLGLKDEAKKTLESLSQYSLFLDKDKIFRAVTLVTFFIKKDTPNLDLFQINTIKNWLQDPEASKQVLQVVFDYKDFVGNINPFDNSRLEIKQSEFSRKLIDCVFASMQRESDTRIYYNKETNDVQQLNEGYLSSHMAENQTEENRRLSNRIINSDTQDSIVNGIHILIPRLALTSFLESFRENSSKCSELVDFVDFFKEDIMKDYSNYYKSVNDLAFSENVDKKFYDALENWYSNKDIDKNELEEILDKTIDDIATKFLLEVNK